MKGADHRSCAPDPGREYLRVTDAGFDVDTRTVLAISRNFWQSFADPTTMGWRRALQLARTAYGDHQGAVVAGAVLHAIEAMMVSRRSCFDFANPDCRHCAAVLMENERQFLSVFLAARDRRRSAAYAHALVLCEGNETDRFLSAMATLAGHLAVVDPVRNVA